MPDPTIMSRLRSETGDEHRMTEAAVDVEKAFSNKASYRILLERYCGFFSGIEPQLREHSFVARHFEDLCFDKAAWLKEDLLSLGVQPRDIDALPSARFEQFASDPAQLMGALYVLEGSMLGGQLLARVLRQRLGLGSEDGGRFFYGYGPASGRAWRAFSDRARAMLNPETAEMTVLAAKKMFGSYTVWMKTPAF